MNRGLRSNKFSKLRLKSSSAGTKSTTEISKFFSKETTNPETASLPDILANVSPSVTQLSSQKRKQQLENNNISAVPDEIEIIPSKRKAKIKTSQSCTTEIAKFFQPQLDNSSDFIATPKKQLPKKQAPKCNMKKYSKPKRSVLDIRNKNKLFTRLNEENDQVDLDHFVDGDKMNDTTNQKLCEEFHIFSAPIVVGQGKRKKWSNVSTTLTRRNKEKQDAKQNKILQSILHVNALSQEIVFDELMGPSLLMSRHLVRFYFPELNVYRKNSAQDELTIDDYYTGDLCDKTMNKCGCLLKNWSKIPGRNPSPTPPNLVTPESVSKSLSENIPAKSSQTEYQQSPFEPFEPEIQDNYSNGVTSSNNGINSEQCDVAPEINQFSRESSPDMFASFESDNSDTSDHISTTTAKSSTECFNNFDQKSFEIIQNYSKLLEIHKEAYGGSPIVMCLKDDDRIKESTNGNQSMLICDMETKHANCLNVEATEVATACISSQSSTKSSAQECEPTRNSNNDGRLSQYSTISILTSSISQSSTELCLQKSPEEVLDDVSPNLNEHNTTFSNESINGDDVPKESQCSTITISNLSICQKLSNSIDSCSRQTSQQSIILLDSDSDSDSNSNTGKQTEDLSSLNESSPYNDDYIDKLLANSFLTSHPKSPSNEDLHKIFDETMTATATSPDKSDELNMINQSVGQFFDISSPKINQSKNVLRKTASDMNMKTGKNSKFSEFLDLTITGSPASTSSNCMHTNDNDDDVDDEIDKLVNEYSFTQPEMNRNSMDDNFYDKYATPSPSPSPSKKENLRSTLNEFEIKHNDQIFSIKCGSNVSPKPNYVRMDSPTRGEHLRKFGLKPLKRHKAIICLEHIYNRLHPFVDMDFGYSSTTQSISQKEIVDQPLS